MKSNSDGKKILLFIFFVMGLFFLMPISFIFISDGFSGFILIPLIMFAIMVFAILFFFKLASKNVKRENQKILYTDDRHCVHCHESIEMHHQFCPYCGKEQTNYIVCDYCGHKNDKRLLQCEECNALIK